MSTWNDVHSLPNVAIKNNHEKIVIIVCGPFGGMEFSLGAHTRAPFFVVTNRILFIDTETSPKWRSLEEGGSGFKVEEEGSDDKSVG